MRSLTRLLYHQPVNIWRFKLNIFVKLGGIYVKISVKGVPLYWLTLEIESLNGNVLKWNSFSRRSEQNSECAVFLHRSTFLIIRIVSCVLFCFCEEFFNQVTDFRETWPERYSIEFPFIVLLFTCVRKIAKSDNLLHHVCLSPRLSVHMDQLAKICRENSCFIKTLQE